jgi:hypothetical protein
MTISQSSLTMSLAVNLLCQTFGENVLNFEAKSGKELKREDDGNARLLIFGSGGRDRTADLGVMNPSLGKVLSICLFKSCSHQGF